MKPPVEIVAVIDIGSSAIRMIIAEVGAKNEIRYLENLQKPVRFGRDVFTSGRISTAAMREGVQILKDYKAVAGGYETKKIQAIATSAVREASNREHFLDQVFVRAGIDVEVIEGPEENRLELIAVEHALGEEFKLEEKNCLIVEVGSGSTELIILNQGKVELTRTLAIGSIRLPEQVVAGKTGTADMQRALKRSIQQVASYSARECAFDTINVFIALGADMRFMARQVLEHPADRYAVVERRAFDTFLTRIAKLSPEEIINQYGLSYGEAETLYPALLFYANFFAETKAEQITVPMVSIRDALLLELAQMLSGYKRTDVSKQVLNSARHLGEKYQYDKPHAACVAAHAMRLFDLLKQDHGMGTRERLLLEVAAVLHDIGAYISPASHHKHSSYLVNASDIFGLRKGDKDIVSNVVRYHRRSLPKPSHVPYMSLSKTDRAVVSKLAAMLRVADAMDAGHRQRVKQFELERWKDAYALWIPEDAGDISIERNAVSEKGDLFAEVFGAAIALRQGAPARSA